ncbi:MAG: hypothetical protein ACPL7I_07300 [Myxococcota bacterium]
MGFENKSVIMKGPEPIASFEYKIKKNSLEIYDFEYIEEYKENALDILEKISNKMGLELKII